MGTGKDGWEREVFDCYRVDFGMKGCLASPLIWRNRVQRYGIQILIRDSLSDPEILVINRQSLLLVLIHNPPTCED